MVHPVNKVFAKKVSLSARTTPVLPSKKDNIYIVRISDVSSPAAANDYRIMLKRLKSDGLAEWDSDKKNRIRVGDWLGFIIGPIRNENVILFKVVDRKGSEHRPKHWNTGKYTAQKVQENVCNREVIYFSEKGPELSWKVWKKTVGYKEGYTPQGTTKANNPY